MFGIREWDSNELLESGFGTYEEADAETVGYEGVGCHVYVSQEEV